MDSQIKTTVGADCDSAVHSKDLFSAVRPTGWMYERLVNISNPRKHRWNKYLRACRAIPETSPVAGSTSWDKINDRRCNLIENRATRNEQEFRALQNVAGAVKAPHLVAQNFLLARVLRRLKAENK
jgi:hypothetical protein